MNERARLEYLDLHTRIKGFITKRLEIADLINLAHERVLVNTAVNHSIQGAEFLD
jgi:hypothetical protein